MSIRISSQLAPITAEQFGAVGDGVADDTVALQAAINTAISTARPLFLYGGHVYKTTAPLLVLSALGTSFVSLHLEGKPISTSNPYPPIIKPTFTNGPAIAIQGARGVRIKGIRIDGLNDYSASLGGNYNNLLNASLYTSGVSARNNRYSPYAAIVVDPFSTTITGGNQYPTLTSYYSGSLAFSSDVNIDDCILQYFYVGVIGIGFGASNTDQVRIKNTQINYTSIAVATCHGQMKSWMLGEGSQVFGALTAIDGVTYGAQSGCCPNISTQLNVGGVKQIFNIPSGTATPNIDGIYAESFLSIGFIGGSLAAGSSAFAIKGSNFQFFTPTTSLAIDTHLFAFRPMSFVGCALIADMPTASFPLRILKDSGCGLSFNDCSIDMQYVDEFQLSSYMGQDDTFCEVYWSNCFIADGLNPSGRGVFSSDQIATGAAGQLVPIGSRVMFEASASEYYCSGVNVNITIGAAITVAISGQNATFNAPSSAIAGVMRIGDQVWTSSTIGLKLPDGTTATTKNGPIGVVTGIAGTAITCTGAPESMTAGNYDLYIPKFKRMHSAGIGSTHSNTTVDAVSNPSNWKIGQRIYGDPTLGIPTGAYVTNVNVGTSTLTISQAATATTPNARIYDADMKVLTGANL